MSHTPNGALSAKPMRVFSYSFTSRRKTTATFVTLISLAASLMLPRVPVQSHPPPVRFALAPAMAFAPLPKIRFAELNKDGDRNHGKGNAYRKLDSNKDGIPNRSGSRSAGEGTG
jgi:hypothetical protein